MLFVSNFRDGGTGWSQAGTDWILALDSVGVDVVCRAVKMNGVNGEPHPRLLQLESKSSQGCDVSIQHVLPPYMVNDHRLGKNIGLFVSETSHFRSSGWADHLNLMDGALVANRQMAGAARDSGVTVPLRVIPHAMDLTRFQRSVPPLDLLKPYKDRGEFLFYFVGEYVRRKHLGALLKAFHTEFDPDEPVRLVIKTNKSGTDPHELEKQVKEDIRKVKQGLRLHGGNPDNYGQEVVITTRLTDEGMLRLHSACDCFVMPSFGEAWCALPGTMVGKTPIEQVKLGDEVLTHRGRLRRVTRTMSRHYQGEVVGLKVKGRNDFLTFTVGHRHFIKARGEPAPRWVKVEDVEVGDYWASPRMNWPDTGGFPTTFLLAEIVEKVKTSYEGGVYNLSVDEDESYTVGPGLATHNCIPAAHAMALGKTPIVPASTGFLDHVSGDEGWLVDCHPEPAFGGLDALPDLYVGDEQWWAVDINHLRRCMRQAYSEEAKRKEKAANGIARAYDFSYEEVGKKMVEALTALT